MPCAGTSCRKNYDRASFSADGPELARSEFEQTLPDRSPRQSPENRSRPDVTWRLTRRAPPARATAIGTEERWFRQQPCLESEELLALPLSRAEAWPGLPHRKAQPAVTEKI